MPIDRAAAAAAIDSFLRALGHPPDKDPHLRGTGERVASAFVDELLAGYGVDPRVLLERHRIESGSRDLVILRDVHVTTMCPHHLLPAAGVATVAFAPNGAIVGLGALVELVDAFAHRLTLQEDVCANVAETMCQVLTPAWAACRIVLEHGCIVHRGERRHGARVETFALRGQLDAESRATAERALGLGT